MGAETSVAASAPTWRDEALDSVRAVAGGLLFGIPLLYTMELWWVGAGTDAGKLLLLIGLLLPLLVVLNAAGGFRRRRSPGFVEACEDAVEVLAVGIVVTGLVLLLLREITFDTPLDTVLGRIVNESIPFCLGAGVARFLLSGDPGIDEGEADDADGQTGDDEEPALDGTVGDLGATALGAAVIGLSIAPTEEVPMLASAMSPPWQVLLVVASIAISYAVVFVAGFSGQDRRHRQEGVFQHPITETMVTYLVALAVAAGMLWVFGREVGPGPTFLANVVVLGLPTAVGGAVGRLAL